MDRNRFIQCMKSNIELSDKERRRIIRRSDDAQIIKDQDEEICLLRNDFMVGSLSEEILNMTVTGIENDENIENTVVVYVTDEED